MTSDDWCTPKHLADALGPFDLDPCSNERSHVQARRRFSLDAGEDGLMSRWIGSVFVNGPYSDPLPWCKRLRDHDGPWCALWKLDPTTRWWAALMESMPTVAPFRKRIRFEGDKSMTANFPSVLVYSAWRPPLALRPYLWLPSYSSAVVSLAEVAA